MQVGKDLTLNLAVGFCLNLQLFERHRHACSIEPAIVTGPLLVSSNVPAARSRVGMSSSWHIEETGHHLPPLSIV